MASLRICGGTCACAAPAMANSANTKAVPASVRAGIEGKENLGIVVS
jgi:hypothetical protein